MARFCLVLLLLLSACKKDSAGVPGVTDSTIKLGSYGPLSGNMAAWSDSLRGMEAYFAYVNAQGGVHGRKIEFVYLDDEYNPAKTPKVVRRLVERERVFALVGGIGTANFMAVKDYVAEQGVPYFTPASGVRLWKGDAPKNVYTVYPNYHTEARTLARHMVDKLELRKIALLYQDDEFGKEGRAGLEEALKARGLSLVAAVSCLPSDTDVSGQVSRIAAAEPDAVVFYAGPRQSVLTVRALHRRKLTPQIVTSFVLGSPRMIRMGGPDWEGVLSGMASKIATSDDPSVVRYREVMKAHGDENLEIGGFSMSGFRFAMPLVEALHRAGPKLTRQTLFDAIESLETYSGGGPYWTDEGLIGPVTFKGGRHRGYDRVFIARAIDGEWVRETEWLGPDD